LSTANSSASDYTITLPAATGTVALTSDITSGTATNFSGSLSGDVTGSQGATVVGKINGATLGTTTATDKNLLIANGSSWSTQAMSGDVTISNTGVTAIGATKVTNAMLAGSIDLTSKVTGILPSANGGTGNGYAKFSGPTSSERTFALPDASATILTSDAAVTVAQGGTGIATTTAFGVITGGTTATGAFQNAGAGTIGQVLTSNGGSALPTWQSASGVSSFSAGSTGLTPNSTTSGAVTLAGTLAVLNGGTGVTSSTGTGSVVLSASPTLTGTPAAPTADVGTNSTQIATTAFVSTAAAAVSGTLIGVRKIDINSTSTTSYTPTTGTKAIVLEMVGGGGGGGGASCTKLDKNIAAGGGGGGGGYLRAYIQFTTLASSYTITIGAAGIGGSSSNSYVSTSGGSTTFRTDANSIPASTTFTAGGGIGGTSHNVTANVKVLIAGGAGGTCTNGEVSAIGSSGGFALVRANEYCFSGSGGFSFFGVGGSANIINGDVNQTINGSSAENYGAGGGGAAVADANVSAKAAGGGAGSAGLIIIYEYK
jgi:hypothetical protein